MKTTLKLFVLIPVLIFGLIFFSGCDDDPSSTDPSPPSCRIIFPANNGSVTDTVMVEIEANDEIAVTKVLLYIDDVLHYETSTAPYEYEWNTRVYDDSTDHKLYCKAWNQDSLSTVSDTVNVMVDYAAGTGQNVLIVSNYNQGAGTLTIIDLYDIGAVDRDVIGVGNTPNDLIFTDNKLLVINSHSHDMNVLKLSYSNAMSQLADPVDIGINSNCYPQYGAAAENGYLYISNFNTDNVTVMDVEALASRIRSDVGRAPQDVLTIGDKVYICNSALDSVTYEYGIGSVSILSTVSNMVVNEIEIGAGKNPQFMALDPQGRILVVCTGTSDFETGEVIIPGEVNVIDPATNAIVSYVYIGGSPGEIAINSDGIAYLAAGGWGDGPGKVFRYDTNNGQILNGPANPIEVSAGAMRIVAADDNMIYVSCYNGNSVVKISGGVIVESYLVGDGPGAMVIVKR